MSEHDIASSGNGINRQPKEGLSNIVCYKESMRDDRIAMTGINRFRPLARVSWVQWDRENYRRNYKADVHS
jgi:hypothetical protein